MLSFDAADSGHQAEKISVVFVSSSRALKVASVYSGPALPAAIACSRSAMRSWVSSVAMCPYSVSPIVLSFLLFLIEENC